MSSSLPKLWIFMPLSCSIIYIKPTHFQTSNAHRHLLRAISFRDCIYTFLKVCIWQHPKMVSSSNFHMMLQTTTKSSLHFKSQYHFIFFYLYYAPMNHFAKKEPAKKINANVNRIHELLNCLVAERCTDVMRSSASIIHEFSVHLPNKHTYNWTLQVMASQFNDTLMTNPPLNGTLYCLCV